MHRSHGAQHGLDEGQERSLIHGRDDRGIRGESSMTYRDSVRANDFGDALVGMVEKCGAMPSARAATLRAQPPTASSCKHDIPIAEKR